MIVCNECGCPYDDVLRSCPECGNPNPQQIQGAFVNTTGLTNCPNCGAPVTNNLKCEYCESMFPRKQATPQQVVINNYEHDDDEYRDNRNDSGIGVGAAAFLGGVLGGLFGD